MKFLAALLLFSAAVSARADILIYNGLAPAREFGLATRIRREREIFVIDTDHQQIQRLHAGIMGRQRVFSVGNVEAIHIIQPILGRRTFTVVSEAETTTGSGTDFTTESLYLRGLNVRVRVASGATRLAPRLLGGTERTVVQDNTQVSSVEQAYAVFINEILTVASNNANETLDEAVTRVTISLQNAGYKKL